MEKTRDITKLRRWCIRKRGEGLRVSEICTATQIPRRTFYNWQARYREGGYERLLTDKSKTANAIYKTTSETIAQVTNLRVETAWCPHKIAAQLRNRGIRISHMTVYRILRSSGLNHPLEKPRMKRTYRRWQRTHPNSLWQCDLKLVPPRWLITILDDHSRFVPASEHFNEGTAENVIWLFDRAVHEYGKPRETLTDHGTQFWSVRRGESMFDAYCERLGIKHILGGIGKPTTQGKIERWFRTYDLEHDRFSVHRKFIHYYNYERPHMSLNYKTPADVYFNSVPNPM
jgi:transposase InsO family protein